MADKMTDIPITTTIKYRRAIKPDAQPFDAISIVTVPRFKTSGLSGDEWRISASILFWRNEELVHKVGPYANVQTAVQFLPAAILQAIDEAKGLYADEGDFCDQEGCCEIATVTYRLKKRYCSSCAEPERYYKGNEIRRFCAKHSTRGDCGIDDADSNYELLEGDVFEPDQEDVSPSIFGDIIDLRHRDD